MKANKDLIQYILELDQTLMNTSAIYLQSINGYYLHLEEGNLNNEMKLNIAYLKKYFQDIKETLIINDEKKISKAYKARQLQKLFLITCPFISDNQKKSFNWVKVNSLQESEIEISMSINSQGQLLQVIQL